MFQAMRGSVELRRQCDGSAVRAAGSAEGQVFDAPPARGGNRANGERQLDGPAVDVLVALRVRDTTVADAER